MLVSKSISNFIIQAFLSLLFVIIPMEYGYSQARFVKGYIYEQTIDNPLQYATISIKGTSHGTISNEEGYFEYKLATNENFPLSIHVSYIGYKDCSFKIKNDSIKYYKIEIQQNELQDIVIRENFEKYLINQAWKLRNENYPNSSSRTKGFIRQTVSKEGEIMYLGEALIDTYKSSYYYAKNENQVQLIKFRKVSNELNYQDSLSLFGAPFLVYNLDFVKLKMSFLNPTKNQHYNYNYTDIISFQNSNHYKVEFESNIDSISGYLLINDQNYAITYIEYNNLKSPVLENKYYKNNHHVSISYRKVKSVYTLNKMVSSLDYINKKTKNELNLHIIYAATDSKVKNCSPIPFDKTISYKTIFMNNTSNSGEHSWDQFTIIAPTKKGTSFIRKYRMNQTNRKSHWASRLTAFSFEIGSGYNFINNKTLTEKLQSTNEEITLKKEEISSILSYFTIGFNINKYYSLHFSSTRNHLFGSNYKSNNWNLKYKYRLTNIGSPLFLDVGFGYSFIQMKQIINQQNQNIISSIKTKHDAISLNLQLSYQLNNNIYLVITGDCNYLINNKYHLCYKSEEDSTNYNVIPASESFINKFNTQLKLGIRYYLASPF